MDRSSARSPLAPRPDLGLLILRIILGIIFCMHGYQKLFIFGFSGVAGAFGGMGVPLPGITGPLVSLLEFFGGISLIIGLLTRLTALGLAIDMLGAIVLVKLHGGFFNPNGYEFELTLALAALALAFTGAGALSADAAITRRRAPGEYPR